MNDNTSWLDVAIALTSEELAQINRELANSQEMAEVRRTMGDEGLGRHAAMSAWNVRFCKAAKRIIDSRKQTGESGRVEKSQSEQRFEWMSSCFARVCETTGYARTDHRVFVVEWKSKRDSLVNVQITGQFKSADDAVDFAMKVECA